MTRTTSFAPGRRAPTVRAGALALLGLAGAGGFVFLTVMRGSASDPPAPAPQTATATAPPQVSVERVSLEPFAPSLRVTGTLKSDEVVALSTKATGLVRSVRARVGDRVQRGQLLVEIDDRDLTAQRDKALAAVRSAEARLTQAQTARGIKNAAVASDHHRAEQALATVQTRLSQARALAKIAATEVDSSVDAARARLQAARDRLKVVQDGARRQEKAAAELAVARTEAQVNKLKANLDRRERLLRDGAIAQEDVENARRDHEAGVAELNAAKQQADLVSEGARSEEIRIAAEEVRQAEAALRSAEANRARRQISNEDVDAAEAQVRQAEAGLEAARAALAQRQWNVDEIRTTRAALEQARAEVRYYDQLIAQTRVYSPVDAVVTEQKAHAGESVSTGKQELLTLVATVTLYFEATAPESALPHLREGGSTAVTLDALPGRRIPGAIREIIPVAEGANRAVRLRISLPRPERFRAVVGGFARASLPGASAEELETEVTDKIEEAVNTISGIDELRSATAEGVSQVIVSFVLEKDGDVAAQQVRDKVNRVLGDLPRDIDPPIIEKFDPDSAPVLALALSAPRPLREITEFADKSLRPRTRGRGGRTTQRSPTLRVGTRAASPCRPSPPSRRLSTARWTRATRDCSGRRCGAGGPWWRCAAWRWGASCRSSRRYQRTSCRRTTSPSSRSTSARPKGRA